MAVKLGFSPKLYYHGQMRLSGRLRVLSYVCLLVAFLGAQETLTFQTQAPDYLFRLRPKIVGPESRPLALALGGGGSKGIAHIGVLQRMEEEGFEPDLVSGTSIGALMGAAFVSGYSGRMLEELLTRDDFGNYLREDMPRNRGVSLSEQEGRSFKLLSMEITRERFNYQPAAIQGFEVKRALSRILGRGAFFAGDDFSRLRCPFRVVATDLQEKGGQGSFAGGSLVDAVRASIAIPGLIQPAMVNGHQYVDGMLMENLPVREARKGLKNAVVLAVDVGGELPTGRANNTLSILGRSLNIAIEQQTRISREDADVLLRPDTSRARHLNFQMSNRRLIEEGKKAFDASLDALEAQVSPSSDWPWNPQVLRLDVPEDLQAPIQALAEATSSGKRFLRRILAGGFAESATLEKVESGGLQLKIQPYPRIQELHFDAEGEWRALMEPALLAENLQPSQRFNPVLLGRVLEKVMLEAILKGRPLIDFRGTGMDDAGRLRVSAREITWGAIGWEGDGALKPKDWNFLGRWLSYAEMGVLRRFFAPLEGQTVDMSVLHKKLRLSEVRFNFSEMGVDMGTMADGRAKLSLHPVSERKVTLYGTAGYESTWGGHFAVDARIAPLASAGQSLDFQGSTNRFQDWARLEFRQALPFFSRVGFSFFGAHARQEVLPESLSELSLLSYYMDGALEMQQRVTDWGGGLYARFGREDRGLVRWDATYRDVELRRVAAKSYRAVNSQFSIEWDRLDRFVLPTKGQVFRYMAGSGREKRPDGSPGKPYIYGYMRFRSLHRLGSRVSLDLDLESGLSLDTGPDRWFILGGPSSILGSQSAGFMHPCFSVTRLALPIRIPNGLSLPMQIEPALCSGVLGDAEMTKEILFHGAGIFFKTELSSLQLELAVSRLWYTRPESEKRHRGSWRINVTFGTRPFDFWKRR